MDSPSAARSPARAAYRSGHAALTWTRRPPLSQPEPPRPPRDERAGRVLTAASRVANALPLADAAGPLPRPEPPPPPPPLRLPPSRLEKMDSRMEAASACQPEAPPSQSAPRVGEQLGAGRGGASGRGRE